MKRAKTERAQNRSKPRGRPATRAHTAPGRAAGADEQQRIADIGFVLTFMALGSARRRARLRQFIERWGGEHGAVLAGADLAGQIAALDQAGDGGPALPDTAKACYRDIGTAAVLLARVPALPIAVLRKTIEGRSAPVGAGQPERGGDTPEPDPETAGVQVADEPADEESDGDEHPAVRSLPELVADLPPAGVLFCTAMHDGPGTEDVCLGVQLFLRDLDCRLVDIECAMESLGVCDELAVNDDRVCAQYASRTIAALRDGANAVQEALVRWTQVVNRGRVIELGGAVFELVRRLAGLQEHEYRRTDARFIIETAVIQLAALPDARERIRVAEEAGCAAGEKHLRELAQRLRTSYGIAEPPKPRAPSRCCAATCGPGR